MSHETSILKVKRGQNYTNNNGIKTYNDVYVIEHDASTSLYSIVNTAGLPKSGDIHPDDNECKVVNISADRSDGAIHTIYTVTYSNESSSSTVPQPTPTEPLMQFRGYHEQVDVSRYLDGTMILNTAGQPITGLTRYDSFGSLRVSIVYNSVNLGNSLNYVGSYNSDKFKFSSSTLNEITVQPGECFFNEFSTSDIVEDGVRKIQVDLDFIFHRRISIGSNDYSYWDQPITNAGMMYLDDDGILKNCIDANGNQVSEPAFLDIDGKQLINAQEEDIVLLTKQKVNSISFHDIFPFFNEAS